MQDVPTGAQVALAAWAYTTQTSTIQEMLVLTAQPGMYSFALGLPAEELFPVEEYMHAAARVLVREARALQYGPPSQVLKTHIVALMKERGVICRVEQVFLTSGAQQAMNLLAHLLLDAHGRVLVEQTIYSGLLQAVEPFQPQLLTVPANAETGMDVDAVELVLASGPPPAFIYAISDGHNPLGASLSLDKRRRLVELARSYHVPIIEDDAYGFLWYDSPGLPPMRAVDEQWVFYVGSFSKILAPALRVGWMLVPEELIPKLAVLKEASDINTATLSQRSIALYLEMYSLAEHLTMLRQVYKARRDTMIQMLERLFSSTGKWNRPNNGMFIWLELAQGVDTGELLKVAVERERVAFLPGHAFGVNGDRSAANCMRLNFSHCSTEEINVGMERLARVLL